MDGGGGVHQNIKSWWKLISGEGVKNGQKFVDVNCEQLLKTGNFNNDIILDILK